MKLTTPSSSVKVKNGYRCTSAPTVYHHGMYRDITFNLGKIHPVMLLHFKKYSYFLPLSTICLLCM
jgi:hypothetical protein